MQNEDADLNPCPISGTGSSQPTNYSVTLNGTSHIGNLKTRTDAIPIPTVTSPPQPNGSRNVTINNSGQRIGDFSTVRNLTLNSSAGHHAIPSGTYGNFTSNSGNGFILGITGSSEPAVYNLQSLTLNSRSRLQIVGPVILTIGSGVTFNATSTTSTNPAWLQMRIASGGLTLNSSSIFYGHVIVPSGTIAINSNARLVGNLSAGRLVVNSNGLVQVTNQ